jgi:hypothetical protein
MPSALAELSPSDSPVGLAPKFFHEHWLTRTLCAQITLLLQAGRHAAPWNHAAPWSLAIAAQIALQDAVSSMPPHELQSLAECVARLFAAAHRHAPVRMHERVRVAAEWREDLIRAMSGTPLPDRWTTADDNMRDYPTRVVKRLRRVWACALRHEPLGETGRSASFWRVSGRRWLTEGAHFPGAEDWVQEAVSLEAAAALYAGGGTERRLATVGLTKAPERWRSPLSTPLLIGAARIAGALGNPAEKPGENLQKRGLQAGERVASMLR